MINTAIILAGGTGTRLQDTLPGVPKCLAPIRGIPFLDYLIAQLQQQGITRFVFSLGHQAALIQEHLRQNFPGLNLEVITETTPLGTGGALVLAAKTCTASDVVVVNGDTYFEGQFAPALAAHEASQAAVTLLLKPMQHYNRYGTVSVNDSLRITGFTEKQPTEAGLVYTGNALLHLPAFLAMPWPPAFSFEKDFLEACHGTLPMYGALREGYFIDIGIAEDYLKAQEELPLLFPVQPNAEWTLFLDRDGVINIEKEQDYIHHWGEFEFYPGAAKTVAQLSQRFGRTIVVTNQKGIGKGVTQESAVIDIHQKLGEAVAAEGGKIDAFFYCPDADSFNRKPNPGMAFQAKARFADIDFSKSLMVGNNLSDLHFGRNAGMFTAFLRTTKPQLLIPNGLANLEASDLRQLLQALTLTKGFC